MTVEFSTPPRTGRRPLYDYEAIAQQLLERPGEWAKVIVDAPATIPSALRKGSVAALRPELGFRFAVRHPRIVDGKEVCTVYARHLPEARESQAVIEARRQARNEDQRRHRASRAERP